MKFKEYLISEATNDKAAKIEKLNKNLAELTKKYSMGDTHTSDETNEFNKRKHEIKNEIKQLKSVKKTDASERQSAADKKHYEWAKKELAKKLPQLKKWENSEEHKEKLKTGFKRGSWQVAILKTDIEKLQKKIDNYEKT